MTHDSTIMTHFLCLFSLKACWRRSNRRRGERRGSPSLPRLHGWWNDCWTTGNTQDALNYTHATCTVYVLLNLLYINYYLVFDQNRCLLSFFAKFYTIVTSFTSASTLDFYPWENVLPLNFFIVLDTNLVLNIKLLKPSVRKSSELLQSEEQRPIGRGVEVVY